MSSSITQLPLLYFENRGTPLRTATGISSSSETDNNNNIDVYLELPAEIVRLCLTQYATWGDLAKAASIQQAWTTLLTDVANTSSRAKWELAHALLDGSDGLVSNPMKAMQLFQKLSIAEESDNEYVVPAMRQMARLYLEGSSDTTTTTTTQKSSKTAINVDTAEGLNWLQRSYNVGDADAAHDLALIYEYGRHGVEIDVIAAFEWFSKAAEAGHIEAMAELGLCYELGCGVEQSDQKALDWYMKAAELGHNTAKYSIGEAFEEARGVPQSDEEACLWYYKAAIEGCEDSRKALRRLEDIARIVVPGARALLSDD